MNDTEYTRVSAVAIASFVFGTLSLLAFCALPVAMLAIVAICLALVARRSIRRYELRGFALLIGGLCLSIPTLILAPAWHLHRYNAEALPDHERLDFAAVADKDWNDLDNTTSDRFASKDMRYQARCTGRILFPSRRMATTEASTMRSVSKCHSIGNISTLRSPSQAPCR